MFTCGAHLSSQGIPGILRARMPRVYRPRQFELLIVRFEKYGEFSERFYHKKCRLVDLCMLLVGVTVMWSIIV